MGHGSCHGCSSFAAAEKANTSECVYQLRPLERAEMAIDHIGVTGIRARIYPGVVVRVEALVKDTSADCNMENHRQTGEPTGQMDLYIEGLRLSDIIGE